MRRGKKLAAYALSAAMLATGFAGVPVSNSLAEELATDVETGEEITEETSEEASLLELEEATPVDADEAGVAINATIFPDAGLRAYVSAYCDKDKNGVLSTTEINATKTIIIACDGFAYDDPFYENYDYKGFDTLKGIEIFTELTTLKLACDYINDTLDFSENTKLETLWLGGQPWGRCSFQGLNISQNVNLKELDISCTELTTLDLTNCKNLISLYCGDTDLEKLDVSNNTLLETLWCDNTSIPKLDITKLSNLKELNVSNRDYRFDPMKIDIDWSKNTKLVELYVSSKGFDKLDVSTLVNLEILECEGSNSFTTLDLTNNTKLKSVDCGGWVIYPFRRDIKASGLKNLEEFTCNMATVGALDLSNCTNLKTVNLNSAGLTSLNVRGCVNMEELCCDKNQLTSLYVSENTALTGINCNDNQLTSLDVSKNVALTDLSCENNSLTRLDLSKNVALRHLYCAYNRLPSLDVRNNKQLQDVSCFDNEYKVASRTIDTTKLLGFDISKVSNVVGGKIQGSNLVMNSTSTNITYDYDCGNDIVVNFKIDYVEVPSKVTLKSAEAASIDIYVSWDALESADSYVVYRKTAGTSWTKIVETTETSFCDFNVIGGIAYTYTVMAVNVAGVGAYDKTGVTATITDLPGKAILKPATVGATAIRVNWEPTATASSYIIYRHAKGESWKKIGTSTTTSYVDATAIGGTNYAYTVKAVNGNGTATEYDKTGVVAKITAKPGKVTLLEPTIGKTAIRVNWKATPTASSYIVYRHAKGESWTKIGTSKTTSYVDTTAIGGKNYAYTVKAVNGNGNSTSYDTTGVIAKITALPGITTMVGATAYTGYINVQWKATATASSYNVYRKTAGGKWTKIGTTTKTAYNDKTAVKGTTYYYTVIAVNGNGACKTYDTTGVKATAK